MSTRMYCDNCERLMIYEQKPEHDDFPSSGGYWTCICGEAISHQWYKKYRVKQPPKHIIPLILDRAERLR